MELTRRAFLSSTLAAGGAALLGRAFLPQAAQATTTGSGGLYTPNGAGLAPSAFLRLPPDAVKAAGWLSTQLQNQLHGLNGQMTYVSHFLQPSTCGWITPSQYGWEEAPYWLRGYANLGYVTDDPATIGTATQWLTGTMATQQASNFFGPDNVATSLNGGFTICAFLICRTSVNYASIVTWVRGEYLIAAGLTGWLGWRCEPGPGGGTGRAMRPSSWWLTSAPPNRRCE